MINPKEGEINIITKPSDLLAKAKVYQQKESEKLRKRELRLHERIFDTMDVNENAYAQRNGLL